MYDECEECGQMCDQEDMHYGLCPDCWDGNGPYNQNEDEEDWEDDLFQREVVNPE